MVDFSENVARLEPSATLAITARAKAMQAEGHSVINLSAGEPSFPTPEVAAAAAAAAVAEGKTGYPPTPGLMELRSAISTYLNQTTDAAGANPTGVLVSAGVKQVLFNLSYCLFGPGDEVLIPSPYWPTYPAVIHLARATPIIVPLDWSDAFRLTAAALEEYRTERTKGILLNSPSNPSGAVIGRQDLQEILTWAGEHDIWVLSDEIYRRLHYGDGSAPSVLDIEDRPERVVALEGMSKAFSMPGWRIGWGLGPGDLIAKGAALQSQTTSAAAAPSQYASAALLSSEQRECVIEDFRSTLERRRKASLAVLRTVPGIAVQDQPGAIYHYIRLGADQDSMDIAEELLARSGVATIPGEAFGTPGYLRITFAGDDELLAEGVRRIADFFG